MLQSFASCNALCNVHTGLVIVDDSGADDLAARREDLFQLLLRQRPRQPTHVDISVTDTLAARTSVRHLYTRAKHRLHSMRHDTTCLGLPRDVTYFEVVADVCDKPVQLLLVSISTIRNAP